MNFLQNAAEIFETARQSNLDGEWAIVVSRDGGIHMTQGAGWSLGALRAANGAQAAYQINRQGGSIRLEAQCAGQRCVLETKRAFPLADLPVYRMLP